MPDLTLPREEEKPTPGPWAWQQMGDWKLVGQHGIRPIVLDAIGPRLRSGPPARATFRVRNAARDLMIEFDSRHPDARMIAAAPDMLTALKEILANCSCEHGCANCDRAEYAISLAENGRAGF